MKKLIALIVVGLVVFSVLSCKKSKSDMADMLPLLAGHGSTVTDGETLTMEGSFPGGTHSLNWMDGLFSFFVPSAYALDPNAVAQVLVFSGKYGIYLADVVNGSFSVSGIDRSSPVGMIFAGSDDSFKGYLTLGGGLDTIPINSADDTISTINLGILNSTGLVVTPTHNPIGDEIPLAEEALDAITQTNFFFAAMIKNPDADSNGKIDLLEEKLYMLSILYFISGGSFGGGLTPTITTPANINMYKLMLLAWEPERPDSVHFTGPAGSNLDCDSEQKVDMGFASTFFSYPPASPLIPPAGTYEISYKTYTFSYDLPDQSGADDNIVLMVPTVVLNPDDTINSITWVYRLGDGTPIDDVSNIVQELDIQIGGSGTPCDSYPQAGLMYSSAQSVGYITTDTTEHVLKCQDLEWSLVTTLGMAYNDVYNNHYVVTYQK